MPRSKILPWKERSFRCVYLSPRKERRAVRRRALARLALQIVRRAISRAPSRFGGSADNMRRQVLESMTMGQRHSFSAFVIDSVKRPVVGLRKVREPGRFSNCGYEFGAELIFHPPFARECVVSLNQEPASRLPQFKWHIALYGEGRRPPLATGMRSVGWRATLFRRFRFTLLRGKAYDFPSVKSGVQ